MQFLAKRVESNIAFLDDEEFFHLTKVLRFKKNDEIKLFDGNNKYRGIISDLFDNKIILKEMVKIDKKVKGFRINLYVGCIERKNFELIVRMGTEIGVDSFIPLITSYTQKKFILDISNKKNRFIDIIKSAVKQSERDSFPVIEESVNFKDIFVDNKKFIVANRELDGFKIFDIDKINRFYPEFNLVIGPEGGFSDEEYKIIKNNNCYLLKLSDNILRTETASLSIISNIIFKLLR